MGETTCIVCFSRSRSFCQDFVFKSCDHHACDDFWLGQKSTGACNNSRRGSVGDAPAWCWECLRDAEPVSSHCCRWDAEEHPHLAGLILLRDLSCHGIYSVHPHPGLCGWFLIAVHGVIAWLVKPLKLPCKFVCLFVFSCSLFFFSRSWE